MGKETISFRIEAESVAVDELAAALDRDRSAIINEAIDSYLARSK
jgi:predicted transcriptional regulator